MSPLDQSQQPRKSDINPSMIPDFLPGNFEELGIKHGDLEKKFIKYALEQEAEEISENDEVALEKRATLLLLLDSMFSDYAESADKNSTFLSTEQCCMKLPSGKVMSLTDSIDRFYSLVPIISGVTEDGAMTANYERLKAPVRIVLRYDEITPEETNITECNLESMILASQEAFEEMAGKIDVIGRFLNSRFKQPNTTDAEVPVTSYLFGNFSSGIQQRLALRAQELPDSQALAISDFHEAKRVSPNFFTITVSVSHLDLASETPTVLGVQKETHAFYAGLDGDGFVFTRWVNERRAQEKREAA